MGVYVLIYALPDNTHPGRRAASVLQTFFGKPSNVAQVMWMIWEMNQSTHRQDDSGDCQPRPWTSKSGIGWHSARRTTEVFFK